METSFQLLLVAVLQDNAFVFKRSCLHMHRFIKIKSYSEEQDFIQKIYFIIVVLNFD